MTAPKRRTIDPKQKAQDALGVAERRLAATEKKIVDLLGQAESLRPVKTAQATEVDYLAQHPLLIADSGSPS